MKHMKQVIIVLAVIIFVGTIYFASAKSVYAADNDKKEVVNEGDKKKEIKGSDKKGKFYFKKVCKSCHGKKGEGGEVTPISKTIKQWERVFKKDKHYKDVK